MRKWTKEAVLRAMKQLGAYDESHGGYGPIGPTEIGVRMGIGAVNASATVRALLVDLVGEGKVVRVSAPGSFRGRYKLLLGGCA